MIKPIFTNKSKQSVNIPPIVAIKTLHEKDTLSVGIIFPIIPPVSPINENPIILKGNTGKPNPRAPEQAPSGSLTDKTPGLP